MAKAKVEKLSGYSRPTYRVASQNGGYDYEYQQFVPEGRRPARTVRGALVNTLDVLEAEDHWMKSDWFKNKNPNLDPEDAFCNSWKACLEGIIGIVTVGAWRNTDPYINSKWSFDGVVSSNAPNFDLYQSTVFHVNSLINDASIPDFNDKGGTTRTKVIELVKRAIKSAPKTK